jgi:hypothetical protein
MINPMVLLFRGGFLLLTFLLTLMTLMRTCTVNLISPPKMTRKILLLKVLLLKVPLLLQVLLLTNLISLKQVLQHLYLIWLNFKLEKRNSERLHVFNYK